MKLLQNNNKLWNRTTMIMCWLVLEDRTKVKNKQEVGKLKTSEAKETQQASFLKFNNQD